MKILIATEWYSPAINGVVVSVDNLRKGLQNLGHDVRILTVSQNKNSIWKDGVTYISSVNASKVYPGARIALTTLRRNRHIQELLRWEPDIIHTQSEFSTFYMAKYIAEQKHIPIVHTYHTVYEDYTHYFTHSKRMGKSLASKFSKQVLKKVACVIVPTEKVKALLIKYGVTSTIEIVPTGIDIENVPLIIDDISKQKLRNALCVPQSNKILVAIGRLAKEKNLEEIMLYLSKMDRPALTLLVVGDGPRFAALLEYAKKLGISKNIIFAGMIDHSEISAYYQIGDVFVNASSSETQGLTTAEAIAYGIPVLCRKDPSLENVIKDGINGWQYETFEEFQSALQGILYQEGEYKIIPDHLSSDKPHQNPLEAFAQTVESIYIKTLHAFNKS